MPAFLGPALLAGLKVLAPAAIGVGTAAVGQKVSNRIARKEQERQIKAARHAELKAAKDSKKDKGNQPSQNISPLPTLPQDNQQPKGNFWSGYPAHFQQLSTVRPEQESAQRQILHQALQNLGNQNKFNFEPIEKQTRQDFERYTKPGIAERFSNSGGSSAYGEQMAQAQKDLELGLAGLKAKHEYEHGTNQQRSLTDLLRLGLQPNYENIFHKGSPGVGEQGLNAILENSPELFTLLSHYLQNRPQNTSQKPAQPGQFRQPSADNSQLLNQIINSGSRNSGFKPNTPTYDAFNAMYPQTKYPTINPNDVNASTKNAFESLYGLSNNQQPVQFTQSNSQPTTRDIMNMLYPKP